MLQDQLDYDEQLDVWSNLIGMWRWMPDLFVDLLRPVDPKTGEKTGFDLGLDQRVLLRGLVRNKRTFVCVSRGYGKCISGDSLVLTEDGLKEIGEYLSYQNDDIETFVDTQKLKIVNRYGKLEQTNAGVYSGYKDTRVITTNEGIEIEPSLNHPLLVMKKNGVMDWKRTEDLEIGDYIVTRRGDNIWGNKTKLEFDMDKWLDSFNKSSRWKIESAKSNTPNELTEDIALIIGYLIGDGCMTRDNGIMFSSKDEDMVNRFIDFFENTINRPVSKKNDIDYLVNGMYVREYFNQIGLKQVDAFKKEIPKCILESPQNMVASCVRGMFDTDGSVTGEYVEYCTASEKMSKQLQTILLNFGIVSNRRKKFNKQFETYSYIISITGKERLRFYNEIGFSCNRKQEKLKNIITKYIDKQSNTNIDVIPYQANVIKKIVDNCNINNKLKDNLRHVLNGSNQLTYIKLDRVLNECAGYNTEELRHLRNIKHENYFFSKIKTIKESKNHVYDLSVPNTNSFIANGIVNHNTTIQLLSLYVKAILYPGIQLSVGAMTQQQSASLFTDKHDDLLNMFPLLANEISYVSITKDKVRIIFKNKSVITSIQMGQASKGLRKHLISVEEFCQTLKDDSSIYFDAIKPILDTNYISPKNGKPDPYVFGTEVFVTTAYNKSIGYEFNVKTFYQMVNLEMATVFGASYILPSRNGRMPQSEEEIAKSEELMGKTWFDANYRSRYFSSAGECIVDIDKLNSLRTIPKPELKGEKGYQYVISCDIARSNNDKNNCTTIAVGKIKRDKRERVKYIEVVNLIRLPNGLTFQAQSIWIRRIQKIYNACTVCIDVVGVGSAVRDILLESDRDPITGEQYKAWDTYNEDIRSDEQGAEQKIWSVYAQKYNHDYLVSIISCVSSGILKLLEPVDSTKVIDAQNEQILKSEILPMAMTNVFIDETSNLTLETNNSGKYSIKQTMKMNKDFFSCIQYLCGYIMNELDGGMEEDEEIDFNTFFSFSAPKIR